MELLGGQVLKEGVAIKHVTDARARFALERLGRPKSIEERLSTLVDPQAK